MFRKSAQDGSLPAALTVSHAQLERFPTRQENVWRESGLFLTTATEVEGAESCPQLLRDVKDSGEVHEKEQSRDLGAQTGLDQKNGGGKKT